MGDPGLRVVLGAGMTAPRTPEDARRDPRPGDRQYTAQDTYTVEHRNDDGVVVLHGRLWSSAPTFGQIVKLEWCSLAKWSALPGTFTPGPGVSS